MLLEQLKERFKDPKDAYRYLYYKKDVAMDFTFYENHPDKENLQKIKDIYDKFNDFLETAPTLDQNSYNNFEKNVIGGIAQKTEKVLLICKYFDFLRQEMTDFFCGMYSINLEVSVKNINSWDQINELIEYENIKELQFNNQKQNQICMDYKIPVIAIRSLRNSNEFLDNIIQGIKKLSEATEIPDNYIFLRKNSIYIDLKKGQYSAYYDSFNSCFMFNHDKIKSTFAHEWMHSLDNLLCQIAGNEFDSIEYLSEKNNTILKDLGFEHLEALCNCFRNELLVDKEQKEELIQKIKENSIHNSIDIGKRFLTNNFTNFADFEQIVKAYYDKPEGKIEDLLKPILKNDYPRHYIEYIENELKMARELNSNKLSNSFFEFAQTADAQINSSKINNLKYTQSIVEMLARSFETYIQTKVANKELITSANDNGLYPRYGEDIIINQKWEKAFNEMKIKLFKHFGLEIKEENTAKIAHHVQESMKWKEKLNKQNNIENNGVKYGRT